MTGKSYSQICIVATAKAEPQIANFSGNRSGSTSHSGVVIGAQKNEAGSNPTFNYNVRGNFYHTDQGTIYQIRR